MIPALVILILALLVSAPVALILVWILRRDVARLGRINADLEARLKRLEVGGGVPEASAMNVAARSAPEAPREAAAARPAGAVPQKAAPLGNRIPADLETLVGGQWLTWLGVLAIFFGTAFFLAFDLGENPLAGPGQILTGLVVAVVFLAAGRAMSSGDRAFLARGLLGGGIALLYLSSYAAHAFHDLVPASVVYPFLLASALIGAVVALREDSLMVASLTQAGAVLTPILLARQGYQPGVLLPYLVSVNIGTLLVSSRRSWPVLPLSGFLGTVLLVCAWWLGQGPQFGRLVPLLGVGALWLLYALFPLVSRATGRFLGVARSFIIVLNALLFEMFLYQLMQPDAAGSGDLTAFRGVATAFLAVAYVAGSRVAEARGPAVPGARMNRYAGLALAVLAIPVQFDLAWVTLGWALLGGVLLWAGVTMGDLGDRLLALGVFVLAIFRVLVLDTIHTVNNIEAYRPLVNGDFLVGAATALVLGGAAWTLSRNRHRLSRLERRLVTPIVLAAVSLFLWRISVETIAYFLARGLRLGVDTGLAALLTLSLIWAVYSGILILCGFLFRYRPVRVLGMAVIGILIVKVFLFDMQELERGYRIASFVGVGLLLLLISILYQRKRRA